MTTISSAISRIRNIIKAVKTDSFLTDRFIYSLISKYADFYTKQEIEKGRIDAFNSFFRTLPCVDLIESNAVDACCDVQSDCFFMRTKNKLPKIMSSLNGPIIRSVSSVDGSTILERTDPATYQRIRKISGAKYNKTKYYWLIDDVMFFPNIDWPQVRIDALFKEDISGFLCENPCLPVQETPVPIPDYLFALIEQSVLKDLGITVQIPQDPQISDKQSQIETS